MDIANERTVRELCQPSIRWEDLADYVPGSLVLVRSADRQAFGFQHDGQWFEMVDGEEYPLEDFEPTEWCKAPGGADAWG